VANKWYCTCSYIGVAACQSHIVLDACIISDTTQAYGYAERDTAAESYRDPVHRGSLLLLCALGHQVCLPVLLPSTITGQNIPNMCICWVCNKLRHLSHKYVSTSHELVVTPADLTSMIAAFQCIPFDEILHPGTHPNAKCLPTIVLLVVPSILVSDVYSWNWGTADIVRRILHRTSSYWFYPSPQSSAYK
jgi:hypothetical protein